jgi:small conductance mechanosensitive channel
MKRIVESRKRNITKPRLLLSAVTALTIVVAIPAAPAEVRPKDPSHEAERVSEPGAPELEQIIRLLEDPAAVRALAERLRALEEARKQETSPAAPKQLEDGKEEGLPRPFVTLLESYEARQDEALSAFSRLRKEATGLAGRWEALRKHLSRQENRRVLIAFSIQFTLALLAGAGAWLVLHGLTRRWERILVEKEARGLGRGIGRVLLTASFRFYPWAGLSLFVFLFFLFFQHIERFRNVLLQGILALALYSGLKNLLQSLLAPERPAARLIPVSDASAGYAYVWTHRALLFTLWMVLLIIPGTAYRLSAWTSAFDAVLKTGLVVILSIILAQRRDAILHSFGLDAREGDSLWRARSKRVFSYVLGKFYLLAVAYMGLVVGLSLLGFREAYLYALHAAGRTLLILLIGAAAFLLWRLLFKKLFDVARPLRERYPDLEHQVNRYVNILEGAGNLLIVLLVLLSVLEAWGLNVYATLSAHSTIVKTLFQIPLIAAGAVFIIQIGRLLITGLEKEIARRMLETRTTSPGEAQKRVGTLGRIGRSLLYLVTITVAAMMVLERMGLDIMPLLAGAGIVGLAVGFGAQNLVKDFISGLFFIVENRIRVGDVAILNGTGGLVEQVNLRTTVLRSLDGTVHVFPNGSINSLSNMTHEFSFYLFNVGVAYKEDTDRVVSVLKAIGEEMLQDDDYKEFILEPLEILGVDQFADSAVIIKARIKTVPIKQWLVGREMNRRIKKRFDEEGIEIPFPHRTFYFGDASRSVEVALKGQTENHQTEQER